VAGFNYTAGDPERYRDGGNARPTASPRERRS